MERSFRIVATVTLSFILIFLILRVLFFADVSFIFPVEKLRDTTKYIIIHHDAIERDVKLKEIYDYHTEMKNFNSIAYHYYLNDFQIIKLHQENEYTNHTGKVNNMAISVCLHGNFNKKKLKGIQRINFCLLIWYLQLKYHVPAKNVLGHSDVSFTDCPGYNINLENIRKYLLWN